MFSQVSKLARGVATPVFKMQMRTFSDGVAPAVLRMRGLPFTATHEDIKQFFDGYQLAENGDQNPVEIIPEDQPPYRPSGMARVTFANSEEASRALEERNRKYLGRRYVELREEW